MRVIKFSGSAALAVGIVLACAIWVFRWSLLVLVIAVAAIIYERRKNNHKPCQCPDCRNINGGVYPQVRHYDQRHWR